MKQVIPFRKEIEFKTMITKITSISLEHTLSLTDEYTIKGDFLLEGTYKMTEASTIEEPFSYKIPVEINIDGKYETSDITIDIDDFTYEILDEEKLSLKIDLLIDNLIEKKEEEKLEVFDSFDDILKEEDLNEVTYNRDESDTEDLFLETSDKIDLMVDEDILKKVDEITNNASNATKDNDKEEDVENEVEKEPEIEEVLELDTTNIEGGVESIFSAFSNTDETFSTYCVYIVRENDTIDSIINKYSTTKEALEEYNDLNNITIGSKIIIPDFINE